MKYFTKLSLLISFMMPVSALAQEVVHDMSPLGMYYAADTVVKAVILTLLLCSVTAWTIFIFKFIQLSYAKRQFFKTYHHWKSKTLLSQLGQESRMDSLGNRFIGEVNDELAISPEITDDLYSRVEYRLQQKVQESIHKLRFGVSLLATIGSTAPFIGLFGTVWGIMNSFIGITQSKTTNLMVVAPGIAEALFATALGLVAAIPAVIIYNLLQRRLQTHQMHLSHLVGTLFLMFKREYPSTAKV